MTDANESQSQNKDAQEQVSPSESDTAQGSESSAADAAPSAPSEPAAPAAAAEEEEPALEDVGTEETVSLERPQLGQEPSQPTAEPQSPEYVPVADWTAAPTWGTPDTATPDSGTPDTGESNPDADGEPPQSVPPIAPGIPPSPSVPPQPPVGSHLPPSAAPTTAFAQQVAPGMMGIQAAAPQASIPENPYLRNRHGQQGQPGGGQGAVPKSTEDAPAYNSPLSGNQQPAGNVPPQISGATPPPVPPVAPPPAVADNGEQPAPAEPPKKQKRTVGIGTLVALMLVAAIGAGATTGVVLASRQGSVSDTISALNEAPAQRSGLAEPGNVSEVAKNVLPTVVSIYVANNSEGGTGSGSIISSDGHVLTNNHVVQLAKDGGKIEVLLNDGSIYEADVVAGDVETDVAVIKIRDVSDLPVVTFGNSDEVVVGDSVLAVGAPHGLTATVTSGIVSALNRPVRIGDESGEVFIDAIQTDASINPGNSGGPLVNMQGQLIGVNSIIYSETQGSVGLGFAIPANQARRYADQLIKDGSISHPKIGVRLDQRYPGPGALIARVEPNSPAEKAGISAGDLIVQVGDRRIGETDAVIAAIRALDFGETVTLKVMNPDSKETRDVQVTLPQQ